MHKRAKEAPDFVVDENRGALLNTNANALKAYKTKRLNRRTMSAVPQRLDRLEQEMGDIKSMLALLLERTK